MVSGRETKPSATTDIVVHARTQQRGREGEPDAPQECTMPAVIRDRQKSMHRENLFYRREHLVKKKGDVGAASRQSISSLLLRK